MLIEIIFVSLVLITCLFLLARNRYPADIILLGGLGVLMLSGILSPDEALGGFAMPGLITIALLYIVVGALDETGAVAWFARYILGKSQNYSVLLARLILPAAIISAFINNSPVVAIFTKVVQEKCKRSAFKISRFLLPLSYASILGGTCTLIGTSTNLVVDSLMRQSGFAGFSLFELASVGVPITIVGVSYLLIFGKFILKDKAGAIEQFSDVREYLLEVLVKPDCELAGQTIEEAGLRHLPGLFLVEIHRDDELLTVVSPQTVIHSGDRMVFAGAVDSVIGLRKIRGLVVADDQVFKLESNQHERRLFEAVISAGNPVNGQSIRDARFRHRYNAVVLSVARNGLRLKEKVGDILLQPGDTLLLEAKKGFLFKYRNSRDFLLISKLENSDTLRHEKAPWALAIMLVMLVLIVTGVMNILQAALLAVAMLLLSRCLNIESARRSVDYQILLVIAGAFGLGAAVQKVGLAQIIAEQALLVSGGEPLIMLVLVYLTTVVLTELVTNNAAAIIMFSIAINGAESLGVSVMPFAVAVMIAASASFITPIGYQTNLMVYGPGGYQYSDYLKLGLPLSILVAIFSLWLIPIFWPF